MTQDYPSYLPTSLILLGIALLIMIVLTFTNRGDLTSATLFLIAFACFFSGLFIFSLERENGEEYKLAAAMAVPYTSTFSRILADLGVQGHAHFIKVSINHTFPAAVMQFNPVSGAIPKRIRENETFYTGKDSPGLLTVPSGNALFEMMKQDKEISFPSSESEIFKVISEVNQELLKIADDTIVNLSNNLIVVELRNFKLLKGCMKIQDESPQNCVMAPCPVCSLAGIIITNGLGKTCVMQEVVIDKETGTVKIHIMLGELM